MRRIVLLAIFVGLVICGSVTLGDEAKSRQGNVPLAATGTVEIEGTQYSFQSEYWGDECQAENGVPTRRGLHDRYLEKQVQYRKSRTVDDIYACYTASSKAWLDQRAAVWPTSIEAQSKSMDVKTQQNIYMTVRATDVSGDHLFVVHSMGAIMAMEKAGPSYTVSCLSKEANAWRLDATISKHPVRFELSEGRWKQFGAPQDMGDQELRRRIRKDIAERERAATQPATAPGQR